MAKESKANGNANEATGTARLPPQDLESERCLLGSMLLAGPAIDEAQTIVQHEHFYADANRRICEAIYAMRDKNRDIDPVTLGKELERRKELTEVGGVAYLVQLIESVPHAAHAATYARAVRETWIRRRIIDTCVESLKFAYDLSADTEDVLVQHDNATQCLLETGVRAAEVQTLGQALMAAVERDEEEQARVNINTGYADLDEITGGLRGGNLIIVAARASMGKTAFCNNLALRLVQAGRPTLFFSLEQSAAEIGERMVSIEGGVSAHKLRKGELNEIEHAKCAESQNRMHGLPLFIDDTGERTVSQLSSVVRLFRRRHQISVVIVDYLQLIRPDDEGVNREQQVARSSRALKHLARNLNVPVIVLAQLNREVEKRENKRPKLSDLRESGSVEQDADQVWAIHRPDYYDPEDSPGEAEIHVLKNRNGPTGKARLYWQKEFMRFVEPVEAQISNANGNDW